jgi:hypothetical protein
VSFFTGCVFSASNCGCSRLVALLAVLCREEAVKLWQQKEEFDKIGARIVCVVHEWIDREVSVDQTPAQPSRTASSQQHL